MRRLAPRALRLALPGAIVNAQPATLLARVQALWPEVAGAALAAATAPVAEREGVVTVACESSLWAQELDLLQRDLLDRMSDPSGPAEGAGVTASPSQSVRLRTARDASRDECRADQRQRGAFCADLRAFVTPSRPAQGVGC